MGYAIRMFGRAQRNAVQKAGRLEDALGAHRAAAAIFRGYLGLARSPDHLAPGMALVHVRAVRINHLIWAPLRNRTVDLVLTMNHVVASLDRLRHDGLRVRYGQAGP
jgi:hypothetical protein